MCNVLGFATCGMGGAACFAGGEREIVVHPGFLSLEFDLRARLCRLATGQLSPSSLLAELQLHHPSLVLVFLKANRGFGDLSGTPEGPFLV